MFVCLCKGITESEVQNAVESGAGSIDEVNEACGAGGDCGGCHEQIEELIDAHAQSTAIQLELIPRRPRPQRRTLPLVSRRTEAA